MNIYILTGIYIAAVLGFLGHNKADAKTHLQNSEENKINFLLENGVSIMPPNTISVQSEPTKPTVSF